MKDSIFIGTPYIRHEGNKARLCSDIKRPSGEFTFYYEVPEEYEKYLCTERINSFLLGILEYAMHLGYDIESDTPMDESLHYQLCSYGSSIIADNLSFMNKIEIKIPFSGEYISSEGAVGTGFSGGVDSFYTVLKHLEQEEPSFQLTHLLVANVGAFTYASTEKTEKIFYDQIRVHTPAAEELGLPLISINTNSNDFYLDGRLDAKYAEGIIAGSPFKIAGCVYAMQKLFSVYYIGSTVQLDKFMFSGRDSGLALLYYTKILSTPSLMFYASGTEVSRIKKVDYISKQDIVSRYITVDMEKNCSRCTKCIRTMFELYALNRLEQFGGRFDIDDFKKHLSSRLGLYFSVKQDRYDGFTDESIQKCRENHVRIPKTAYLKYWILYKPFTCMKNLLRQNRMVRRMYYKFNVDIRLGRDPRWRDSFQDWERAKK